jgi:hypothetical protein
MSDERDTQRKLPQGTPLRGSIREPEAPIAVAPVPATSRLTAADVMDRIRRLPPAITLLTLASMGSIVFMMIAVTGHTTPVAVLLSAGVITGLIFATDAALAGHACWSAAVDGQAGRATLLAGVSFVFMLVCAGNLAAVTIMILVLNGWP